jgi:membrane protein YqaA with SNARE-associated domain
MIEYALLFATAFAAATLLPAPSEVPLAWLAARDGVPWPVTVATLGNVLGACTTFLLARLAASRWPASAPASPRGRAWVERYGAPALLLSWVPIVGDGIVAVAGAGGMRAGRFLIWTTLGKAARYWAVAAVAARQAGPHL